MLDDGISSHNGNHDKLQAQLIAFSTKCRDSGLKVTPQRMAVYRALIESCSHPSAENLYRQVRQELPNISLDTVNRTLQTLNQIGAAFTVEGSGDAKRFDGNTDDHQHFKCVKCKNIVDIYDENFGEIQSPAALDGCSVLRKTVYFEGICNQCKQKS
jgi:Fur family transcriptional regulator, peroxide stress response regulator